MANPSQLFLLADHVKLSLLERQRAISLNLEPNSQDGHISRSLESLREGVEAVERERDELEAKDDSSFATLQDQASRLRKQFDDLTSQFHGFPTSTPSPSISQPNDPSLASDFSHAKDTKPSRRQQSSSSSPRPRVPSSSSFLNRNRSPNVANNSPKNVRFSDNPTVSSNEEEDPNRAALFPYRDDPSPPPEDQSHLSNEQIHTYHSNVLEEQDEQLDRLGESIGRQRELSIQIGDELDSHVQLLDEVDEHVDRHQGRLDGARRRLTTFARKAKDNMQLTVILILIIILILLIIILK
ncbi:MAG: hypothetical protein M4579_001289 [Chaenotheca gracillima]|nr:MAG: hypothetical protein M4579_001289 [Chaenotheca gracillima]